MNNYGNRFYFKRWEKKRKKNCKPYGVDNSIEVSKELVEKCGSVKAALRKLSDEVGFQYDESWTVQQLGKKLLDFVENK
mgnify:CR=1 FL=1